MSEKSIFSEKINAVNNAEESLRNAIKELLSDIDKKLKGVVKFYSRQEYDDNNYYTEISFSIGSVYIYNYEFDDIDELDVIQTVKERIAKRKSKTGQIKEILKFEDDEEEFPESVEAAIKHCLDNNVELEDFFEGVSVLRDISYSLIPSDRITVEG